MMSEILESALARPNTFLPDEYSLCPTCVVRQEILQGNVIGAGYQSILDPSLPHSQHCSSLKEDNYEETRRIELRQLQKLSEILTVVSCHFDRPHASARKLSIHTLSRRMCQILNAADVIQTFIELGAAAVLR